MPRLFRGRADWDLILKSNTADPIYLRFDRERFIQRGGAAPFSINAAYMPFEPGEQGSIQLEEWTWGNGPAGAGTSVETPLSNQMGASEFGDFVWLRRIGVAQPAGKLRQITLPSGVASTTGSVLSAASFEEGQVFNGDLFITTRTNYIVRVPSGNPGNTLTERDTGFPGATMGIDIFDGTGSSRLYVGDIGRGIQEWDGTTWAVGAAGTERGWLKVPYWVLGDQLATGGSAGAAGAGANRLVGTNAANTTLLHVSGDPKVTANWSAETRIGPASNTYRVNRLVGDNRTVWAGTGQGVYGIDGLGYTQNLTHWMTATAAVDNCRAIAFWDGLIWAGHEHGLTAFRPDGSRVDFANFLQFGGMSGAISIAGRPTAISPFPGGLYVAYWDGAFGNWGTLLKNQDGSYRWSMAEGSILGERVTYLQQVVDTAGTPRLFVGTRVESTGHIRLYWQSLPKSGDPENDSLNGGPFEAAELWILQLSEWDAGRPVPKTVRRYAMDAKYMGSAYPANTVTVSVKPDGTDFLIQGTATQSPRWVSSPTSALLRATTLQVAFNARNTSTSPIVISRFSVRYSPHPELTKVKTYPVIFGEGVTGQDPAIVLARLEAAQHEGPIEIIDELGRTLQGMVEPGLREVITEEEPGQGWTVHADVTISVARVGSYFDVDSFDAAESRFS